MKNYLKVVVLAFIFIFAGTQSVFAKGTKTYYSGSKHTSSHGGHYSSGKGSSHKGGTYKNTRTSNHYGSHKK